MNSTCYQPEEMFVVEPPGFTELVRGAEQRLISLFTPLVQRQSVALDLSKVERIDAAGIAALIKLYSDSVHAGHAFAVCNVSAHVAEILTVVGLAPILMVKDGTPIQRACAAA